MLDFEGPKICVVTHPIEDWRPPFHSDALKDSQHGKSDVVKRGDAEVRSFPLLQADGHIGLTGVSSFRGLSVGDHQVCSLTKVNLE